ncbi:hypothetical protein AcV7_004914 [Taiwanofungus camphoratus]|nr:hypothetical protein AcV7_004914 [Antrodia cinnamomea]
MARKKKAAVCINGDMTAPQLVNSLSKIQNERTNINFNQLDDMEKALIFSSNGQERSHLLSIARRTKY